MNKLCARYRKQNLLVIWDGVAIHCSEAVKALLKAKPGRIHLERLPVYSPERNPVELVWSHLKRSLKNQRGRPAVFSNLAELTTAVLERINALEEI